MNRKPWPKESIIVGHTNSYHLYRTDADFFLSLAKETGHGGSFDATRLSRTAILLYILSLEALVNQALAHYLRGALRDVILEKERSFSLLEKWEMLPKLASEDESRSFDKSAYPWSHLSELNKIRNDYVHPKSHRPYVNQVSAEHKTYSMLEPNQIPDSLEFADDKGRVIPVVEKTLRYCQTGVPRDPSQLLPENAEVVRQVVDDTIKELDQLMSGAIEREKFLLGTEEFKIIHPPAWRGKTIRIRPQKD